MRTLLTFIALTIILPAFGQDVPNDKLTELAKAWSGFMMRNDPPKQFISDLRTNMPESLRPATEFIIQTITKDNELLKDKYLALPDAATIKNISIIRSITANIRDEYKIDNNKLIDSLKATDIARNELIHNYYEMLFIGVGNKRKPFNLSKVNFNLNNYSLTNDTEKGIFFLECMALCGTVIWGYMNVVKPPNLNEAYYHITKYPKFNSLSYYQFTDLHFPDFQFAVRDGKESYKSFYLDKYYELLLNHLTCLRQGGAPENVINDFMLGSILKDRVLYKYSKKKDQLDRIFTTQRSQ